MCTFITLIAATDDRDGLNAVLATLDRRGPSRRAEPVNIQAVQDLLAADERAYLLVRAPCDCGTYLGHARRGADPEARRAADMVRYRRKGWSAARIARALTDRDRAGARPGRRPPNEDADYWIGLMTALAAGLGLARLGLMHHFDDRYELDAVARREAGASEHEAETLAHMEDGVIHDFRMGAGGR